jgi:nitrile hydratase subunit beta
VVEHLHGAHVFPDATVLGQGDDRFDSRELWGADADPTVKVSVDAFEPYLEPA